MLFGAFCCQSCFRNEWPRLTAPPLISKENKSPMKTSVPQVWSINDQKHLFGTIVEKGLEVYRLSGDIDMLDQAVKFAREFYDSEMKIAGHKRTLNWDHINEASKALEKVEEIVRRRKAAIAMTNGEH